MKNRALHIIYVVLFIILVALTVLSCKAALLDARASTIMDVYLAAAAVGGSVILSIYGLVLLIGGVVKKRSALRFLGILFSLIFIVGLGVANFILFFLILGFTGSG